MRVQSQLIQEQRSKKKNPVEGKEKANQSQGDQNQEKKKKRNIVGKIVFKHALHSQKDPKVCLRSR